MSSKSSQYVEFTLKAEDKGLITTALKEKKLDEFLEKNGLERGLQVRKEKIEDTYYYLPGEVDFDSDDSLKKIRKSIRDHVETIKYVQRITSDDPLCPDEKRVEIVDEGQEERLLEQGYQKSITLKIDRTVYAVKKGFDIVIDKIGKNTRFISLRSRNNAVDAVACKKIFAGLLKYLGIESDSAEILEKSYFQILIQQKHIYEKRDALIMKAKKELLYRDKQDNAGAKEMDDLLEGKILKSERVPKEYTLDTVECSKEDTVQLVYDILHNKSAVVAIVGPSGTGKSTIAETISSKLNAVKVSLGDTFRICFVNCFDKNPEKLRANVGSFFADFEYKIINGKLKYVYKGEVINEMDVVYRSPEVNKYMADYNKYIQDLVISKVNSSLPVLKTQAGIIFLEGRWYTLEYFDKDYLFTLEADDDTRAKRRLEQDIKNHLQKSVQKGKPKGYAQIIEEMYSRISE